MSFEAVNIGDTTKLGDFYIFINDIKVDYIKNTNAVELIRKLDEYLENVDRGKYKKLGIEKTGYFAIKDKNNNPVYGIGGSLGRRLYSVFGFKLLTDDQKLRHDLNWFYDNYTEEQKSNIKNKYYKCKDE